MGKQISNSSILLTSAIPLDARSHFVTYSAAKAAVDRTTIEGESVVMSTSDAKVTSGTYQNYYLGQLITTEQNGVFTVVASGGYDALGAALEEEWKKNVIYKYDHSKTQLTITTVAGSYLKDYSITLTGKTGTVTLIDDLIEFYSVYDVDGALLRVKLGLGSSSDNVNPLEVKFIGDNTTLSPHLQPLSAGGGGGGSSIAGAITTDGTLLDIVNGRIKVGNLAALDRVGTGQLEETLLSLVNRTMNESQFEFDKDNNM